MSYQSSELFMLMYYKAGHVIDEAPALKSHEANLRKFGLCMRIPQKS